MSTLHRIRELALVATLGMGALVGSAALACEQPAGTRASIELFADLGQMTVEADRDAAILGSMTVTAERLPAIDSRVADLGTMTVTAPRAMNIQVADLGSMTVEASRIETIRIAARTSN